MMIFRKKHKYWLCATVGLWIGAAANLPAAYAQTQFNPAREQYLQQEILRSQYIAQYSYENWLVKSFEAAKRNDLNFPFGQLLNSYARGVNYDPMATNTIEQMYNLAYEVQNSDVNGNDDALQKFKQLLNKHAPNYDVINAAIPLVRDNAYLGDLQYLEWMRSGLQRRLLKSGQDGTVAASAYNIYTPGEERFLLRYHNAKLVNTETLATGSAYYHIHLVEDQQSGAPFRIYMRLTDIMRRMEAQQQLVDPSYQYTVKPPASFKME